jgi:hypothetical protein
MSSLSTKYVSPTDRARGLADKYKKLSIYDAAFAVGSIVLGAERHQAIFRIVCGFGIALDRQRLLQKVDPLNE